MKHRHTNVFAIVKEIKKNDQLLLTINTKKAVFRHMPWEELGDFGKRKFENMLFLLRLHDKREHCKIIYA